MLHADPLVERDALRSESVESDVDRVAAVERSLERDLQECAGDAAVPLVPTYGELVHPDLVGVDQERPADDLAARARRARDPRVRTRHARSSSCATWRAWTVGGRAPRRTRPRTSPSASSSSPGPEGAQRDAFGRRGIGRTFRVLHRQDPRGVSRGVAGGDQQPDRVRRPVVDRLSHARRASITARRSDHRRSQVPIPRPRASGWTSTQRAMPLGHEPPADESRVVQTPTESTCGSKPGRRKSEVRSSRSQHGVADVVHLARVGERDDVVDVVDGEGSGS